MRPVYGLAVVAMLCLAGCGSTTATTVTAPAQTITTVRVARAQAVTQTSVVVHERTRTVVRVATPITITSTQVAATSQPPGTIPVPDPAVCSDLYNQYEDGGPSSSAAIQEYGSIGCGQSARTDGNTWCKNVRSTSTDVPGYPAGQLEAICDFPPHTPGTYPPSG